MGTVQFHLQHFHLFPQIHQYVINTILLSERSDEVSHQPAEMNYCVTHQSLLEAEEDAWEWKFHGASRSSEHANDASYLYILMCVCIYKWIISWGSLGRLPSSHFERRIPQKYIWWAKSNINSNAWNPINHQILASVNWLEGYLQTKESSMFTFHCCIKSSVFSPACSCIAMMRVFFSDFQVQDGLVLIDCFMPV